jgi:hypothetical protein
MRWLPARVGRSSRAPRDVVERLTRRGLFRVTRQSTSLDDRETVQSWLRELRPDRDQQVFVHRSWGTVAAVADGRHDVAVLLSHGGKSWFAVPPGGPDKAHLTPDQIEHILLDAMTAPKRPQWPDWRHLI